MLGLTTRLAALGLGALASFAAVAWGVGFTVSMVRGAVRETYLAGFTAGQTECALAASREVNVALERAQSEAIAAQSARVDAIKDKERSIADAENRYRDALARARRDPETARCLDADLPHGLQLSP